MALAQITVLRRPTRKQFKMREGVLNSVHEALVEVLQVPADDPKVWLTLPPHLDVSVHPASQNPPALLVQVTLFSGRSAQTKERLHRTIAQNLEAVGVPANEVAVVMIESPRENWSVAGVPSDQVDLGFRVDI
jgi:hypothetical protein